MTTSTYAGSRVTMFLSCCKSREKERDTFSILNEGRFANRSRKASRNLASSGCRLSCCSPASVVACSCMCVRAPCRDASLFINCFEHSRRLVGLEQLPHFSVAAVEDGGRAEWQRFLQHLWGRTKVSRCSGPAESGDAQGPRTQHLHYRQSLAQWL